MTGKKVREDVRPGRVSAKENVKEIAKKSKVISKGRIVGAHARQTRSTSGKIGREIEGYLSGGVVKVIAVRSGREERVDVKTNFNKHGPREKPRTRASTRSESLASKCDESLSAIDPGNDEVVRSVSVCSVSVDNTLGTIDQESASQDVTSTYPISKRVPELCAQERFGKFYGRRTICGAQRSRLKNGESSSFSHKFKCMRTLRSNSSITADKLAAELAIRLTPTTNGQDLGTGSKVICGERKDCAMTRQTTAGCQTRKPVKLGGQTRKEIDSNMNRYGLLEKPQTRAAKRSGPQAARFATLGSESSGDDETESALALTDSEDNERPWTNQQVTALQDAYWTIRPTPDFWRLISKRVPGRSAEECFDKFYSGHPTPPRSAVRARQKEMDTPLCLSGSPKARAAGGKRRLLLAHKTVRIILRKQQVEDEDYEADAFAALEHPDVVQSVLESAEDEAAVELNATEIKRSAAAVLLPRTADLSRPEPSPDKENRTPNAVVKSRNRWNSQPQQLWTPDVLKKVKNPVQLDKYIDHLHHRHARKPKALASQKNPKQRTTLSVKSKDATNFGDTTLDAMQRAKQELRNVFLTSGRVGEEVFYITASNTSDERGNESDDSQLSI